MDPMTYTPPRSRPAKRRNWTAIILGILGGLTLLTVLAGVLMARAFSNAFLSTPEDRLAFAIQMQNVGSVRKQLQQDPTLANHAGKLMQQRPLTLAAMIGNEAIIKALLEAKADVNARDEHGVTALEMTAMRRTPAMAELLIAHGADPAGKNEDGRTTLHLAARLGNLELVKALQRHGADINARDRWGNTPLREAKTGMQSSTEMPAFARTMVKVAEKQQGGQGPFMPTPERCKAVAAYLQQQGGVE